MGWRFLGPGTQDRSPQNSGLVCWALSDAMFTYLCVSICVHTFLGGWVSPAAR